MSAGTGTTFHFQVVGDDSIDGKDSLVEQYASGKDLEVDGKTAKVKLSHYLDSRVEKTISWNLMELTDSTVDGYIFIYNVSDLDSFHRLGVWMTRLDMCLKSTCIIQKPKILFGSLSTSGKRTVEFERAWEFALSANMMYSEVNMNEDYLEIKTAIAALIREKLPPSILQQKTFTRNRTVSEIVENGKRGASNTAPISITAPLEHSMTVQKSDELNILTAALISLNSSVASLSMLLRDESDEETNQLSALAARPRTRATTITSPFTRLIKVAVDAEKCVKSAETKITSMRKASDETLSALVKQLEEKHQLVDELTAENGELQQLLEEADRKNQTSQKQIEDLRQALGSRREDSNNWEVKKSEVEITSKDLGTGGYATVAVANFRGSMVAAKRLHSVILNSHNRGTFEREMNIAARIRHPNLVQFMGAVVDKEPIILMELMPTSLREVLPKELNRLTQEQMPPICRDVARALTYLHAMKPEPIIHRDISSANILLEPAANSLWRAKVSDYGSANFLSMLKTQAPGNAVYAAPEAQFPRQQSPKMDVFSFGVLVMEMYLREFPDPNNRDQMVYEVGILYPDILSVVESCLRDDPEHRLCMYDVLQLLNHS